MKDFPIVYECDYKRNKECPKTVCQDLCFHTKDAKYSIDGKRYKYNADTDKLEDLDA